MPCSLLIRVRDPADQAAARQFVEIYWPVIHRLARRKGMQDADADDVAQTVLLSSLPKPSSGGSTYPQRARFPDLAGPRRPKCHPQRPDSLQTGCASGDFRDTEAIIEQQASGDGPDSALLQLEYRREVFRWAAQQIRQEFAPQTWDAFAAHDRRGGRKTAKPSLASLAKT